MVDDDDDDDDDPIFIPLQGNGILYSYVKNHQT